MFKYCIMFGLLHLTSSDFSVAVRSDGDCGGTFNLNDGSFYLQYYGTRLNDCKFTVEEVDSSNKICVYFEQLDLSSCQTTLKLYGYHSNEGERVDFHTFYCGSEKLYEYCPPFVTKLYIKLKHPAPLSNDIVVIKIESSNDALYVYIIVGLIAFVFVMVAIPTMILLRHRYKRSRSSFMLDDNVPCPMVATISRPKR